ncbi:FRG domain-containing protein [Pseudoalteromonas sp. APC 3355]|uniref:FRG domain-containing protein n=1 Tax=Pseudoalteromonas sp. APC 3355 TaxID=3035199 RepID=UPI0025B4E044|nr:FRG domain-containing protein [Pseudoalteromonas sp. APC 3355]MDN3473250.1 FRG domain-containing protein [Pseudoalteromonas sp. APC 3355]
MSRKPRWKKITNDKGAATYELSSWKYFSDYINQELLEHKSYVFRGHADSNWKLEPTLDRFVDSSTSPKREAILEQFKFETRGRRGSHPPLMESENDWWALGQHHGLCTPLLDWSESPFVALYFAASAAFKSKSKSMSIFAFFQGSAEVFNKAIRDDKDVALINKHKPTVKVIRPLSDENSRLVSQRGLFTRAPNNMDLESWVKKYNTYKGGEMTIIKIVIPTKDIEKCLKYLNRMNINHSTLFPDLTGASEYCNKLLSIDGY